MKMIIKKYYLVPFIVFLILFSLKALGLKSPNSPLENIFIVIGGVLILSLIVGTIYYFQDTKWGPAKREKKFSKSPFTDLFGIGFKREGDFMMGKINGYTTIVMYTWQMGKPSIVIDILFDPWVSDHFLTMKEVIALEKKNKGSNLWKANQLDWTRNSIRHVIEYNFSSPSFQKIIAKAEEMSGVLLKEGLHPISYERNEEIIPELIKAIENEKTMKISG